MIALAAAKAPEIDWAGLSPLLALLGGSVVVLMVGLMRSRAARHGIVPALTLAFFAAAIGLAIWQWDERGTLMSEALALDPLYLFGIVGVAVAGVMAVFLSFGAAAPREASHGEYHALLLVAAGGMVVFAGAQNLITAFLGLELLSIPLYILAASELHRRRSLESGMKYLIVGSVGSATLLYGFAMIFGATGTTDYAGIAAAISRDGLANDPLLMGGVAFAIVGLAFKASVAPFHQWTPDVYEGAPTPVTAFMATATKVATLIAMIRLFDVALPGASHVWGPLLAILAAIAMIVGNVGALGQESMKRMLAFSSVAQAGYMLVGVVVGTQLGAEATVFYVLAYVVMTAAAFAVIDASERETGHDGGQGLVGLGQRRPLHAAAISVALLGLAGLPGTVGFVAKLRLVQSGVDGGYTWLMIILVIGSMISFVYYLGVLARVWSTSEQTDLVAGAAGGPVGAAGPVATDLGAAAVPADRQTSVRTPWTTTVVALVAGVAVVVLGIIPGPLMNAVEAVRDSLPGIF
ncbi:MAG: NADH-quinone oxidoreductase subunit N [Patulibacter sp.]